MSKTALLFPGQGAQFVGMGKELYASNAAAKARFDEANDILGLDITALMFDGTEEQLRDTKITQPALYIHSTLKFDDVKDSLNYQATAGHSLGEFSALYAAGALSWADGLRLVQARANAMQSACESVEGTMAAVLGLDDKVVEEVCSEIDAVVVPANYNCPAQLVISGSVQGIDLAVAKMLEKGARKAVKLNVGGAFHSPLMMPAQDELATAIKNTTISRPDVPVYQNVSASPITEIDQIKANLINQLTSPVRWTQTMAAMTGNGLNHFVEIGGNGKVLRGLMRRYDRSIPVDTMI